MLPGHFMPLQAVWQCQAHPVHSSRHTWGCAHAIDKASTQRQQSAVPLSCTHRAPLTGLSASCQWSSHITILYAEFTNGAQPWLTWPSEAFICTEQAEEDLLSSYRLERATHLFSKACTPGDFYLNFLETYLANHMLTCLSC